MDRRGFVLQGLGAGLVTMAGGGAGGGAVADPSPELEEMSVAELQEAMTSGRWTAQVIVERYLQRIEALDRTGPTLRSVIELNPDAEAIAQARDAERARGKVRGPLHGVPVLIKDNFDTADRMGTTAGSLALRGPAPTSDAFLVTRLREAGAVLVGKTNLSEWANFRSLRSTSGWSARGGQTRNPYVLDRNPCGSSSGSAVAVAANLTCVALGTETDGSVVCPSSTNGIVGVKPTLGRLSRSGIVPIAHSQDTAGPMARTVRDAAVLLEALVGQDADDPATGSARGRPADFTSGLTPDALKGARIGVARTFFGFNDHVDRVMEGALSALRDAGAVLIDPAEAAGLQGFDDSEMEVLLYEFKADLNEYLSRRKVEGAGSLEELIAFNEKNREREMPWFGQELFVMAQKKGGLEDEPYLKALHDSKQKAGAEGIDAAIEKHRLDALVAPTGGPAWPTDLINGDHYTGGYSSASAVSGYPHVTVPAGNVQGLPVGLSLFGAAWSEAKLLSLAFAFEQATRARLVPRYLTTLALA